MDINEIEKEVLEFWEKDKTFEKSLKGKKKNYVFYDGPPFATGLPHYGHLLASAIKDTIPRFWTMKGHKVERVWGWDCHGLPIEALAEQKLKLKNKKEIEEKGVDKFCNYCEGMVLEYVKEWKKTINRIGRWVDFDNSYKTMDISYMESVWWAFKEIWKKDLIYEGKRVLLYCPRCQTPLSNSEIAMDNSYKNVNEQSVTVKFPLKGEENTYLLAWTTTPWTLPGNSALYINKDLEYVKVKPKDKEEYYILAKERVKDVIKGDYEIVENIDVKDLFRKSYEPLFDYYKDFDENYYKIDFADFVSADQGTGLVHSAIMYGIDDYERAQEQNLKHNHTVDKAGKMVDSVEVAKGLFFKDADKKILEDLKKRNLVYEIKMNSHSYPFCYRCDTPLLYYALDSWFVNIQKAKKDILKNSQKTNWHPDYLKEGRVKNIVEQAPDWNISRNRYWASVIPVWKCECGEMEVIGSIDELKKKAISLPKKLDLHKHAMDKVFFKCKCGKKMKRIPEVLDCWFESGSMPFAQMHYPFENKSWPDKNLPADFVAEYIAQTRTWFYYMNVLSTLLFGKQPFKNVSTTGTILAENGDKMSKSKRNFPDPMKVIDRYGADALRFYLLSSTVMNAEDIRFKERGIDEVYKKVLLLFYNVAQFYSTCEKVKSSKIKSSDVLDKWVISRLAELNRDVDDNLVKYNTVGATRVIRDFMSDLSTWYVRRSRDRISKDPVARETLKNVLVELCKVLAPLLPFASENVYRKISGSKDSVHLEDWPNVDVKKIDDDLLKSMKLVRDISSMALKERDSSKINIRWPLAKVIVSGVELGEEFAEIIKDEINVRDVEFKKGNEISVKLDTKMNDELKAEGFTREIARKIQAERKNKGLSKGDLVDLKVFADEEILNYFRKNEEFLKERINAKKLEFVDDKMPKDAILSTIQERKIGLLFS
jgi:isoleucyl-tRNA synthetase